VLLADDHEIVREGLASILDEYADLDVVGEAGDGHEAVRLARRHAPDVVVMDVAMPGLDGVGATRHIVAAMPGVRVIGLSLHDSPELAAAMTAAGAVAYLHKDGPLEDLIAQIRGSRGPGR